MLPATSIFRRMPGALELAQRRRLGALAYASDSAELSFQRLKEVARAYRFPGDDLTHEAAGWTPEHRLSIVTDAWACIDHLNRAKKLVQRFKVADPPPAEIGLFVHAMGPAAKIRNRLQHLDEDIFEGKNSVQGHPVLGTVSWSDKRVSTGHIRYSISSGPTIDGGLMAEVSTSDTPLTGDIVDVQLMAADQTVNLDDMMQALTEFMTAFEVLVFRAVLLAIRAAAEAQGVSLDQPRPTGISDMTTAIWLRDKTDAGWALTPDCMQMLVEVPLGAFDISAV